MRKKPSTERIKKDISKTFDVSAWVFFYNKQGYLEFYDFSPTYSYVYNSDFENYNEDIKNISYRLLWQNSQSQK